MQDLIKRHVYQPLRIAFGLVPILAGLDKFVNLLADWPAYISPIAADLVPVGPATLMYVVGAIEILVGVMVLTRWTRLGAQLAAGWLVLIALNLLSMGIFDVAVRDLVMAVAAYGLANLATAYAAAPLGQQSVPEPTATS